MPVEGMPTLDLGSRWPCTGGRERGVPGGEPEWGKPARRKELGALRELTASLGLRLGGQASGMQFSFTGAPGTGEL